MQLSLDTTIDNMMAFGVDILMMQDENGIVDDTGMHGTKIAAKMLHQLGLESDDPKITLPLVSSLAGLMDFSLHMYARRTIVYGF